MARRAKKRNTRLPLPWERASRPFAGALSGRRVWPVMTLLCTGALLCGAYFLGARHIAIDSTRAVLTEVRRATHAFVMDVGRCPHDAQELVHPPRSGIQYLGEPPTDAWGRAVYLHCNDGDELSVEALSAGPSGSFLDDDNIM